MFFADNVAPLVNTIFDSPIGAESFTIMLGALAFGIQIYGDFSGYSDIAIGIALILGFKFPKNFNKPYFATSPANFWHRWHISLSTWLRDYLYIPLGGNKKSRGHTYFNLMTVMFLGGLWHGASWNFIVWGVLHGCYLSIHKLLLDRFPKIRKHWFFNTKLGKVFSILITQYLVFFAWIAFRVKDLDDMLYSMQKYVFLDFQIEQTIQIILQNRFEILIILLFIIFHFISYRRTNLLDQISSLKLPFWILFLTGIISVILFFYSGNPEGFIYFQF
jgi:D-alanyl-lipoteichoic acid acyltransferase DltB (MBOAT superfamily)